MKILHVASEYPPAKIYGLGRFVHGLARAQAAQGDDVQVFTNSHGGEQDDVVVDGVHLHRIAFPNPPQPADGQGEVLQFNHGIVARYLERREAFQDVELINSHDWLTAIAAREIASDLGVPLVVTVHDEVVGKRFGDPRGNDLFVRDLEALSVHDASQVIANSGYVARQVTSHYGVEPERVSAIPGGIDPALLIVEFPERVTDFRASLAQPGELLVLYVGRLDPEKGLAVLADAALALHAQGVPLKLVLAGTGRLEAALRQQLAPLGGQAAFLGYVTGERLKYLYRSADVVCVPSLYEPFGLVALEGLLAGSAVVASATGGLTEIVEDGRTGLSVPPGDAVALAEALASLARDPELRTQLGQAGNERARTVLSWSTIAERTRAAYSLALQRPRAVCVSAPERPPAAPVSLLLAVPPGQAEAAAAGLRSLLTRTDYSALEVWVVLVEVSEAERAHLEEAVAELARDGYAVALLPEDHEDQDEDDREASTATAWEQVLGVTNGEYLCLVDRAFAVPTGSEGWLTGLAWLLVDQGAASVRPRWTDQAAGSLLTGSAPSRSASGEPNGVLVRRDDLTQVVGPEPQSLAELLAQLPGAHWTHPVQLQRLDSTAAAAAPPVIAGLPAMAGLPASVVLIAHDGLADTERALQALVDHTATPFELVLIDNGSSDGTGARFEALQAELADRVPVQVLTNETNLGFPKAANQGIRAAQGEHVVLLNNDAEVRPGWLRALLDAAQSGSEDAPIGAVTAKILNPDLTIQNAGGILHHPDGSFTIPHQGEDRLAPTVSARCAVESTAGPCTLLTRTLIEQVGLFDEAYSPAYYEDSDLCQRAREAGLVLLYEPGAEVVHQAQRTSVRLVREGKLDLDRVLAENKARYYARWQGQIDADEAARQVVQLADRLPRHRVLLCYGKSETTTAAYVEAALRRSHDVVTAGPGQRVDPGRVVSARELCELAGGRFDLLLCVEGENYFPSAPWDAPCPTALWAIDNHLHAARPDGWHFDLAAGFDHVFLAQKDYLDAFAARGVDARWLPLACDHQVHSPAQQSLRKEVDVVFVGHVRPFHQRRRRLLDRLKQHFRVEEVQGVFREEMAAQFARARIVFNCSLAGDLNMRVFEALASGSLLLTDRIEAGLGQLFGQREHLVLYDDDTLEDEVERYLTNAAAREAIAVRGQRLALAHHTYAARLDQLLRTVREQVRAGDSLIPTPTATPEQEVAA